MESSSVLTDSGRHGKGAYICVCVFVYGYMCVHVLVCLCEYDLCTGIVLSELRDVTSIFNLGPLV